MVEYSSIMALILEYLKSQTKGTSAPTSAVAQKSTQQVLLDEMINSLNNKWITLIWFTLIHLAGLTFIPKNVLMLDAVIFMGMIALKLNQYCRFMDSQHW